MRGSVPERLMGTFLIIEQEVVAQAPHGLFDAIILVEIHLLVFQRTPQALDENVVESPPSAVHTDGHAMSFQDADKGLGRELGTLIRVEYLRLGNAQGMVQPLYAEFYVQGDRDCPSYDVTAEPIQNRHEVDKATPHAYVSDIRCPYLVRPIDDEPFEQERVFLVSGVDAG